MLKCRIWSYASALRFRFVFVFVIAIISVILDAMGFSSVFFRFSLDNVLLILVHADIHGFGIDEP